jgi:HPt (histidine-containing phosphotransfer) domain-containing protein
MNGPAAPPDPVPPIDLTALRSRAFGDPDLERELLILFTRQGQEAALTLADADLAAEDLWAVVHRLKGAARAVGASHVADLAQVVEDGGEDASSMGPALNRLVAALKQACDYAASLVGRN